MQRTETKDIIMATPVNHSQSSSPASREILSSKCPYPKCKVYTPANHAHGKNGFPAVRIAKRSTDKVNPDATYPNKIFCLEENEFCPGLQTLDFWIRAKHYKTKAAEMLEELDGRWKGLSEVTFRNISWKKEVKTFMAENKADMDKLSESVTYVFTYLPFLNDLGIRLNAEYQRISGKTFPAKAFDEICTIAVHRNNLCPSHDYGSRHRRHRAYFPDRIDPGPILSDSKHSVMRKVLDEILAEHLGFQGSVNFIGFIPCKYANPYASENGFTDDYLTSSPLHNKYTHLTQQGSRAVAGLLKKKHFPEIVNTGIWANMLDRVTFKNGKCTEVDDALSGSATNPLNHQLICGLFSRGVRNILIEQDEALIRVTLADYFQVPDAMTMSLEKCTAQLERILFNLRCVETYFLDSFFKGMDRFVKRVSTDEMATYRDSQGRWILENKPENPDCAEDIFSLPTLSCVDFLIPLTAAAQRKGEQHCENGTGIKVCEGTATGYIIWPSGKGLGDIPKSDDAG